MKRLLAILALLVVSIVTCSDRSDAARGMVSLNPQQGKKQIIHFIHTGQSLCTGHEGTPALSTSQPYSNVQLWDWSLSYNINSPNAASLALVPLVAPMRSNVTGGVNQYPANVEGETAEVAMANTLAQKLGLQFATTNNGYSGQALSVIQKGGSSNSYAAGIYEAKAIKALAPAYTVGAVVLTHGEADATNAAYLTGIETLQSNYQTDLQAVSGQATTIPMIVSQQNSFPIVGGGANLSAVEQWQAVLNNPGTFLGAGPKYWRTFQSDGAHYTNAGYVSLGEDYARAYFRYFTLGSWTPLIVTHVAFNSATVTVTLNVPVPPLVWDSAHTGPHGAATKYGDGGSVFGSGNIGWTGCNGFEGWTGGYGGTPVGCRQALIQGSQVVLTFVSAPDTIAYAHTPDQASGNTGGFPSGRCGLLRDSDAWVGYSGNTQYNWAWEMSQQGNL